MTEHEDVNITNKNNKKLSIDPLIGVIFLIIGIIILVLGINYLFFGSIEGDMLQEMEYNTFSSLLVLLGIYTTSLGLHLLLKKLKKSIKAYLLIAFGIFNIIFATVIPRILNTYVLIGFLAYLFFGLGSILYGGYSLSKIFKKREKLVYGNIVSMVLLLILILIFY